jgi:uncharacterized protein (DUF1015 family)
VALLSVKAMLDEDISILTHRMHPWNHIKAETELQHFDVVVFTVEGKHKIDDISETFSQFSI